MPAKKVKADGKQPSIMSFFKPVATNEKPAPRESPLLVKEVPETTISKPLAEGSSTTEVDALHAPLPEPTVVVKKRGRVVLDSDSSYVDGSGGESSEETEETGSDAASEREEDGIDDGDAGEEEQGEEKDVDIRPKKKTKKSKAAELDVFGSFESDPKRREKFLKVLAKRTREEELGNVSSANAPAGSGTSSTPSRLGESYMPKYNPRLKYTPLEKQFLELKQQYPDAVLFVECGYRYCFFGPDAEIASSVLHIMAFKKNNFLTTSVPVHRLNVHLSRLVQANYKAAVIKQSETAAVKAHSDKKSGLFKRQCAGIYTSSTFITAEVDSNEEKGHGGTLTAFCLLLVERKNGQVICLGADPSTGDMVFETIERDNLVSAMYALFSSLEPCELLLPAEVSPELQVLVKQRTCRCVTLSDDWIQQAGGRAWLDAAVSSSSSSSTTANGSEAWLQGCKSWMRHYLQEFGLESLLENEQGEVRRLDLSTGQQMVLGGETLRNLEIFTTADGSHIGSLWWLLNQTQTRFGARLLKRWLLAPLVHPALIQERQQRVQSFIADEAAGDVQKMLGKLPDLERSLRRIQFARCSPPELLSCLQGFVSLTACAEQHPHLFPGFPALGPSFQRIWQQICQVSPQSKVGLPELFRDNDPAINQHRQALLELKQRSVSELQRVRQVLRMSSLEFKTVNGAPLVLEISLTANHKIPTDWTLLPSTKKMRRYHTPELVAIVSAMELENELLLAAAKAAWQRLLEDLASELTLWQQAITAAATLDCIAALAALSSRESWTFPNILPYSPAEGARLELRDARHPVLESLLPGGLVSNDCALDTRTVYTHIITGPNMGGKSSYMKQVALCVILGQLGCAVPATQAQLTPVDAIYTRMGGYDNLFSGQSTFFVEMSEAANALAHATPQSLVMMDELGRGTSTHDGSAMAFAVLGYLVNTLKCRTLFVTHYPLLAVFEHSHAQAVANWHLGFITVPPNVNNHLSSSSHLKGPEDENDEEREKDDEKDDHSLQSNPADQLIFTYKYTSGISPRSFGLECARLAGLPDSIVETARGLAWELEKVVLGRQRQRLCVQSAALRTLLETNAQQPPSLDQLISLQKEMQQLTGQ